MVALGAISLAGLLLAGLLGSVGVASGETLGHAYSFSFGSAGTGNGQFENDDGAFGLNIGVDQSTGDVYVADTSNHRVEKFDSQGNFIGAWGYGVKDGKVESEVCTAPSLCLTGIQGSAPGQMEGPNGIAVDNSGGSNDGDVYVVDSGGLFQPGQQAIVKFSSDGTYLGTIDGSDTPTGRFEHVGSATVDSQGFLWVTTVSNTMEFSNESENEYVAGSEWEGGGYFIGIDAAGSKLFLENHVVSTNGSNPQPPYTEGYGATVNHMNDHVFAFVCCPGTEGGWAVQEYTEHGQPVGPAFSANKAGFCLSPGLGGGMAIDEATDTFYVVDACASKVFALGPRIVPAVSTGAATSVSHTTATITGETTPDPSGGGDVAECNFELGTDTSYGTKVPCAPAVPYSGHTAVHADLSGLTMDTEYHYRLAAANSIDVNRGADHTFVPRRVVGLTTDEATNVGRTGATLTGSFEANGEDTHYFFEWGTSNSYGHVTPTELTPGTTPALASVQAEISGLSTYVKYHYRIVASNALGTSHGKDEVLRTQAAAPPAVGETSASAVTASGVRLIASINPDSSATVYRFQYGLDASYGKQTPVSESIGEDGSPHTVSADLAGLEPGTTYHFRVMATNFGGTSLGPDMTFTTQGPPSIGDISISAIGATGATVEASVNPELSPTTVHFEFGESAAYGASTPESGVLGSDRSRHAISRLIGGLLPGTTYHLRVVASNAIGVSQSLDRTFTTAAPPASIPPPQATRCRRGFVKRHGQCVRKARRTGRRHSHRRTGNG
jgi:phosphodiesterase/alkaline phosphatase D-like protein